MERGHGGSSQVRGRRSRCPGWMRSGSGPTGAVEPVDPVPAGGDGAVVGPRREGALGHAQSVSPARTPPCRRPRGGPAAAGPSGRRPRPHRGGRRGARRVSPPRGRPRPGRSRRPPAPGGARGGGRRTPRRLRSRPRRPPPLSAATARPHRPARPRRTATPAGRRTGSRPGWRRPPGRAVERGTRHARDGDPDAQAPETWCTPLTRLVLHPRSLRLLAFDPVKAPMGKASTVHPQCRAGHHLRA